MCPLLVTSRSWALGSGRCCITEAPPRLQSVCCLCASLQCLLKAWREESQPQTGLGQQLSNASVSGPLYTWPHVDLTARQRPSLHHHQPGDAVFNIGGGWQYIQCEGDPGIQSIAFKTLRNSGKAQSRSKDIFRRPSFLPSLLIPSRSSRFPILGL